MDTKATYKGKDLTDLEHEALKILVNKVAPNPEDFKLDEANHAVHPMGVHVKEVPGKKVEGLPAFKVTKVGSKVKEHGGIKVGEHIHDNHIDDLSDMGHKIKTEEKQVVVEEQETEEVYVEHMCAKHVLHPVLGEGQVIEGEHAFPDDNGDIAWYKVQFENSVQLIKTEDVKIMHESMHGHKMKKKVSEKNNRTFKLRGQTSTGEPNPISKNGAFVSGPEDQLQKEGHSLAQQAAIAISKKNRGMKEDMHDADESLPKDAKKKVMNGKSKYKGLDKANGDDDKDAVETTSEEIQPDFTVIEHNAFSLDLPNQLLFADYLHAAQMFTEDYNEAVLVADNFFNNKDETIIYEAVTRSDIEDRISAHQKAGKNVSKPKYGTKDGKPTAEYTVTDKETGQSTRYLHHGNIRRVERRS